MAPRHLSAVIEAAAAFAMAAVAAGAVAGLLALGGGLLAPKLPPEPGWHLGTEAPALDDVPVIWYAVGQAPRMAIFGGGIWPEVDDQGRILEPLWPPDFWIEDPTAAR